MKHYEEKEDVISNYVLNDFDNASYDRDGIHVIPYSNVFIVIETRKVNCNKYLGWFSVQPSNKEMFGWRYLTEYNSWHIFQLEKDFIDNPPPLKIYSEESQLSSF